MDRTHDPLFRADESRRSSACSRPRASTLSTAASASSLRCRRSSPRRSSWRGGTSCARPRRRRGRPRCSRWYKFVHQVISVLYNKVESSDICLRLFLLAAQSADESGFEELAYEFYVQSFTIYEESISVVARVLHAIGLIISTLQTARVFGTDNYDTLIHQGGAARRQAAQDSRPGGGGHYGEPPMVADRGAGPSVAAGYQFVVGDGQCGCQSECGRGCAGDGAGGKESKPILLKDGKRVLECLQKVDAHRQQLHRRTQHRRDLLLGPRSVPLLFRAAGGMRWRPSTSTRSSSDFQRFGFAHGRAGRRGSRFASCHCGRRVFGDAHHARFVPAPL